MSGRAVCLRWPQGPVGIADGDDEILGSVCAGHGFHRDYARRPLQQRWCPAYARRWMATKYAGRLDSHGSHLVCGPPGVVHNGRVRRYCTTQVLTRSHIRVMAPICAGPVRIPAGRCAELRAAAPSGAAPVGGLIGRGLPAAERAAPESAGGGACRLLLPSVVTGSLSPQKPGDSPPFVGRIGREHTR